MRCGPLKGMQLEMLSQGGRVSVALAAATEATRVWFAARVNVGVLLAVGTVGKTTITTRIVALEWPLTYTIT